MDYIYARVSSQEQDTRNQVAELKTQFPYAHVVEETKSTRKVRPKLVEVLELLEKGDRLIVWKLDRLSRNMMELQQICNNLDDRGINLIATTQNVDISNPMGKMFIALLGMMAEMERENISERTLLGMKRTKAEFEIQAEKCRAEGKKVEVWVLRKGKRTKITEWRKPTTHKKGGRTHIPRSPKCLARIAELSMLGLTWKRIAEKLAYENPAWKMHPNTVMKTRGRMFSRELIDRKSFKPKVLKEDR